MVRVVRVAAPRGLRAGNDPEREPGGWLEIGGRSPETLERRAATGARSEPGPPRTDGVADCRGAPARAALERGPAPGAGHESGAPGARRVTPAPARRRAAPSGARSGSASSARPARRPSTAGPPAPPPRTPRPQLGEVDGPHRRHPGHDRVIREGPRHRHRERLGRRRVRAASVGRRHRHQRRALRHRRHSHPAPGHRHRCHRRQRRARPRRSTHRRTRSGCWTRSVRFNIIWPDWLRARRFIRCRNVMPTSTAFCGA